MITEKFKLNSDTSLNRYDIAKFIKKIQPGFWDIVDSEFITNLNLIKKFEYYTVTTEYGRPDLISEKIYGLGYSQYWWIIMIINGYLLPNDIKTGDVIKYPSLSTLETIYFSLLNNSLGSNSSTTEKKLI